jgi:hypothetical protein
MKSSTLKAGAAALATQVVIVPLSSIKPNPFRDPARYPMDEATIATLVASIHESGFWQNTVLGRRSAGEIQLVFGHKRIEAAKRALGADQSIKLHLAQVDDAETLRKLFLENMHEWNANARNWIEDLRTVVLAFAEGKIGLPKANRRAFDLRQAASFCKTKPDADAGYVYNATTLHAFNPAWDIADVRVGLDILEQIELGNLKIDVFDKLTPQQAKEVLNEVLTAQRLVLREALIHRQAADAAERQAREAAQTVEQDASPEVRSEAAKVAARAAKVVESERAAAVEAEQGMAQIMAEVGDSTAGAYRDGKPAADVKKIVKETQRRIAQTEVVTERMQPVDHAAVMVAETEHLYRSFRKKQREFEDALRHAGEFDAVRRDKILTMWEEIGKFADKVGTVLVATAPRQPGEDSTTHVRAHERRLQPGA